KEVPLRFITVAAFTVYAIGHNIVASVFSGALVRYRAYSSLGLGGKDIGILVAFCSFTFFLGSLLLGGIVLLVEPRLAGRFFDSGSLWMPLTGGMLMSRLVGLSVIGRGLRV